MQSSVESSLESSEQRPVPGVDLKAIFAVVVAMLSIQSGAALAKHLFPVVGPQGATAFRLFFAALLLCLIFRPWRTKLSRQDGIATIVYGLSLGAMNYTFYLALERIPLGIAVALEFTGPLAVAIFASRRAVDFLWAVLAVIGIILILPLTEIAGPVDPMGAFYALAAGAFWAAYIIFGQRAGKTGNSGNIAAYGMVAAAVLVVPFGIASAGATLFDLKLLPWAIGIGIFSSALPYSLEMTALKRMPAKNFGILMSLEPAIAALSGLLFLSEALSITQWLAIALVIAASLGSAASARRPTEAVKLAND